MAKVVHCKREPYDVYIGRPSEWGNPFSTVAKKGHPGYSRDEAVDKYREYLLANPRLMKRLWELKGKTLGCWCAPKRCHGDVLLELANE